MKREVTLSLFAAMAVLMLFFTASSQARTLTTKALAATNSSPAFNGQREAMRMVPARAVLKNTINARKIQVGDKFEAALAATVHLKNGSVLSRGTKLIGAVVRDKMQDGSASTLALRFTQARLKNGKAVPIKATIVLVSPPAYSYSGEMYSAANYWNDKTLQVDQINAESGVNLHSAIASRNSGVFVTTKKDNVKLPAGSQLALAIAARKNSHQHATGMNHAQASSGA